MHGVISFHSLGVPKTSEADRLSENKQSCHALSRNGNTRLSSHLLRLSSHLLRLSSHLLRLFFQTPRYVSSSNCPVSPHSQEPTNQKRGSLSANTAVIMKQSSFPDQGLSLCEIDNILLSSYHLGNSWHAVPGCCN